MKFVPHAKYFVKVVKYVTYGVENSIIITLILMK